MNKAAFKLTPARFHFTKAPHNTVDAGNSLVFNSSNLPDVSFSHSQGDASLHDLRDWEGIDDVVDAVTVWEIRVIARTRFVRAIAWTGKIAILINKEMTYMLQKVRSERPYVDRK